VKVLYDPAQKVPIKMWTDGVHVDVGAAEQLHAAAQMPFIYKHIAVMPDVHKGLGSTIGSVIPTVGAIMPATVGVDIGCGMRACKTNFTGDDLPRNLKCIRAAIELAVPHGRSDGSLDDIGSWRGHVPDIARGQFDTWFRDGLTKMLKKHPKLAGAVPPHDQALNMLGTLGTGNHFIEICLDEDDKVWIMLHSGSRGIGNRIGTYFIKQAKEEMNKWHIDLPSKDLAYLPEHTDLFEDYYKMVQWAQMYAKDSRDIMMERVGWVLRQSLERPIEFEEEIDCHHNYVTKEQHFGKNVFVTRKGAVCARKGMKGIIPGSMGARSYIVEGLGNPESFTSCSHGAGRVMSRTEARRRISVVEHAEATKHVECRQDAEVLDESPACYKDIDTVMEAQKDLVKPIHVLRQVICVKG
jgi:tRNA-splicing ligase RtcB